MDHFNWPLKNFQQAKDNYIEKLELSKWKSERLNVEITIKPIESNPVNVEIRRTHDSLTLDRLAAIELIRGLKYVFGLKGDE